MPNLKILISVYACAPNCGSEPGMGWNFIKGLSKYHKIHVLTEEYEFKKEIENYLEENHDLQNVTFHFIPIKQHVILRKIWPPSYYWFHKKWHRDVYKLGLKLDEKENFDIIHQLNMTGFREPGFLWKINKPFVWGPIGGLINSPWRFLPSLGFKGMVYFVGRNIINSWQRKYKIRARKAIEHNNSALIAATPDTAEIIKRLWYRNSTVICEVGQEYNIIPLSNKRIVTNPLKVIWSGVHTARKNLPLLLNALKNAKFPFELHILGNGELTKKWKEKAKTLELNNYCFWHGWLEHKTAIEVMQTGHVLCITSISDLTSTVTLEALSYGLPIICLDHCGFAHVVTEKCGIKIPVNTPREAALNIKLALEKLYKNEALRQSLSAGAIDRAADFCWNKKTQDLNAIYESLLEEKN